MTSQRCISWLHAPTDRTAAVPGESFCALHLSEKQEADRVRDDLRLLAGEVRRFARDHGQHPDEAKDFLGKRSQG